MTVSSGSKARFSLRLLAALSLLSGLAPAARALEPSPLAGAIDRAAAAVAGDLIEWRRHLHAHPELSNQEVETARFVAEKLRAMGLAPRTGVAGNGVVAVIEGSRPGPVVALRADLDALPVAEEVDLPFASHATATYEGKSVPVMHACGHDAHTAILLATAQVLYSLRDRLPGQVVLIFQPAEEGAPVEQGVAGAERMVAEGVLDSPRVDVVYGLHVWAGLETGKLGYRSGPALAAVDSFEIVVEGRQTHGAKPWAGIDPIVTASEIVGALQTIVSRRLEITREPAVVSVGQFEAGVRSNIIPDRARLVGTIRTFDEEMRDEVHARLKQIAEGVAQAHGATARVRIDRGYPVTANDRALVARMLPTLARVAPGRTVELSKLTVAEDFSFFANRVPGFYFMLGVTPAEKVVTAAANHSPRFEVDEAALATGVRALAHLAADTLFAGPALH
jgi:amidohydrolase